MTSRLRVIADSAHDAAFNMAADLYLIDKCTKENTMYLRFYEWDPPAITIGFSQKPDQLLNLEKCTSTKLDWVRRPTGGRAVLHWEDITYSCIFPKTMSVMGSSVQESYHTISEALLCGLKFAGIPCDTHDSFDELKQVRRDIKLPCFLAPNRDEIMVHGKKLIGSAQKRSADAVLQHGSIPLSARYRTLPLFLNITEPEQAMQIGLLEQKSICINEIMPDLQQEELKRYLIGGFLQSFSISSIEQSWTTDECKEISGIAESVDFVQDWLTA